MEYKIIGTTMPVVEVTLQRGESMYTQSGGMAWQTDGIAMDTNTRGGLMKGLGRMLAGETLFMATYKAEQEGAMIAFASTVPGEIITVDVSQANLICQKGAFLCAEQDVELNTVLTKKFSSGLLGGEGFILQELRGSGTAFLEIDGDKVEKELAPGEALKVDTGNVVAFEKSVSYEVEMVKGLKNIFLGGEGLMLTRLVGPGRVILQTQNFAEFTGRVAARIPSK